MKRYEPGLLFDDLFGDSATMTEAVDGEWVRYEDHVAEVDRLTAALEAAERESAHWSSTAAAWQDQLLQLRETVDAFEKARKRLTSRGGMA